LLFSYIICKESRHFDSVSSVVGIFVKSSELFFVCIIIKVNFFWELDENELPTPISPLTNYEVHYFRPRKDHFKNDLRSDQDHLLKNDLRSDQDNIFSKK
jgi:hypothetical protein